jgi:hypothetical protein
VSLPGASSLSFLLLSSYGGATPLRPLQEGVSLFSVVAGLDAPSRVRRRITTDYLKA